jgi:hypothetical protein
MDNLENDLQKDKTSNRERLLNRLARKESDRFLASSSEDEDSGDDYTASSGKNSEDESYLDTNVNTQEVVNIQEEVVKPIQQSRATLRKTTSSRNNKRKTIKRKTTKKTLIKKNNATNTKKKSKPVRIPRRLSMGITVTDFADHLDDLPEYDDLSSSSDSDDYDGNDVIPSDTDDSESDLDVRVR